jgi:hypothetical protein
MNAKAHSQHRVYRFFWENPGATSQAAAKELGMSPVAVRLAKHRLKARKTALLCPFCFEEALEGLVCRACGAELDAEPVLSEIVDSQSAVHTIQPLGGLGSKTNYRGLRLQYGARNIEHLAEAPDDALLERCKSQLWQELKGPMLPDWITEEATRLMVREVTTFRRNYPGLVRSKGLGDQLVRNVLSLVKLRYPGRFGETPKQGQSPLLEAEPHV